MPRGPWMAPGLVATLLVVAVAGVCEWSLRRAGHRPSFDDDPIWWALHRRKVDDDPRALAFLGSSRMQLAVSRAALEVELPGVHPVQLAIDGTSALGTLEHLAADPDFTGVVVCDLAEWDVTPKAWEDQKRWIAQYERFWRAPGTLANVWLRGLAKQRLTVIGLNGRLVIAAAMRDRGWPEQRWVVTSSDRFRAADYGRARKKHLKAKAEENRSWLPRDPLAPDAWLAEMDRVERAVATIQARGGRVVIVRLPTSGRHWELADAMFPRAQYWDRFAQRTAAVALHFADVPGLADLECPDEAHLDQRDQVQFTRGLVAALRARGVL